MRGKEGKDSRINEICIVQGLIGRNLRRLSIEDNVVKKKKKTRLRDNLSNFSISLSLSLSFSFLSFSLLLDNSQWNKERGRLGVA